MGFKGISDSKFADFAAKRTFRWQTGVLKTNIGFFCF